MIARAKFGVGALIAIILLLSPPGYCADSMGAEQTPAHPCCPAKPAPMPDGCSRPGCIYLDTHITPLAVASPDSGAVGETDSLPVTIQAPEPVATALGKPLEPRPPFELFVRFHQLLI